MNCDNYDYIVWKVQIAETIPHERRFKNALVKLFKAQEKEVLKNVKKVKLPASKKELELKQDIETVLSDITFDKTEWDIEFIRKMTPFYEAMALTAGKRVFAELGVGIEFDVEDRAVKRFIKNKTIKFSGFVNGETAERLNRIIKPIVARGGSVEIVRRDIQEAVRKVYDSSIRGTASRARKIARTEMVGTANGSQLEGFKQSGVVQLKGWLRSADERVRDTHVQAGVDFSRFKGIPLDQHFKVGKARLSSPGNLISGPVGEAINCRCTLITAKRRKK